MLKIIAFIYYRRRNDKHTKDIAHFQCFTRVCLFYTPPCILIGLKYFNFEPTLLIAHMAGGNRFLESIIGGIIIVLPQYGIFYWIYPPKKLIEAYPKYQYSKYYRHYLTALVLLSLALSVLYILIDKNKIIPVWLK